MIDAVLFDWRGTLFTDETEEDWVRNAASSIGRRLEDDEITAILERGAAVLREQPGIHAAFERCDTSTDAHRQATLRWLYAAGLDEDLATAIWARDGAPDASFPFADTERVATLILPGPFTSGDASARGLSAVLRLVGVEADPRPRPSVS